ncbi:MAG: hypothetical protein EZS28_035258 [Streblomastix strix]|uniref:Uncharacterized protein n=1 Tax=Streblomastix strix TaxID=222440 RepID=A0A5J4UI19_9EUKA|nr:MAG: hypothetical protein EZS28_035258 [Streblomastix strix]
MAGYKATDACLNRIRQFYSQHPFVVLAQHVEVWSFPTSASITGIRTSQNIPLSHVTDFCLLGKDPAFTDTYNPNSVINEPANDLASRAMLWRITKRVQVNRKPGEIRMSLSDELLLRAEMERMENSPKSQRADRVLALIKVHKIKRVTDFQL